MGSGNTLVLPTGCTFTLSAADNGVNGLPAVASNLSIEGSGDTITASATGFRFFDITVAGVTLNIDDLTLTNASVTSDGGAIFTITNNYHLIVTNSTFSGNTGDDGGAIASEGEGGGGHLTVIGSTFNGNTSATTTFEGGGIHNDVQAFIINSTFTGNSAGRGGGIEASNGSTLTTIINSTIDGNTATAATAPGGGGLSADMSVHLLNSIVADNTGLNCVGTPVDAGNNLENGTSCGFTTNAVNAEPAVSALANNGGPTKTMAITSTSPAFDGASLSVCQAANPNGAAGVDQRGDPRSDATGATKCDIGAFEVQGVVITPTPTISVPPTGAVDGASSATGAGELLIAGGTTVVVLAACGLLLSVVPRRQR